jgi:hypothetical protein
LERIENFFRRLEEYAKVPMTEAMKEIMVKIMVEVLEIFAIMTNEIEHEQSSESIPDDMSPVVNRGSEMSLEKIFKKLIGKKGIKDALSRLDRSTQEAVKMATVILEVAHLINGGVLSIGYALNQLIEGTFGTLATHKYYLKPTNN